MKPGDRIWLAILRMGRRKAIAADLMERRRVAQEAKRQAFVRLASKRTEAVIERLRVLSNCSNPYAYEYTDDDVLANLEPKMFCTSTARLGVTGLSC